MWRDAEAEVLPEREPSVRVLRIEDEGRSDGQRALLWLAPSLCALLVFLGWLLARGHCVSTALPWCGTNISATSGNETPAAEEGATGPPQTWPSADEARLYDLLVQTRAAGFACPSGRVYPPNPKPIFFDCRLWRAARQHAVDMGVNDYFAHVTPNGETVCDRTRAQGLEGCQENIAAGFGTPDAALAGLLKSGEHCDNMLDENVNRVGMGAAAVRMSRYLVYWVQDFAFDGLAIDASCSPPRPPGGGDGDLGCVDYNPAGCAPWRGYENTSGCASGWPAANCKRTCARCA